MQMTINLVFDLDTMAGKELLSQFQHLVLPKLLPTNQPVLGSPLSSPPATVADPTDPYPAEPVPPLTPADQLKIARQAAAANARAAKEKAAAAKTKPAAPGPVEQVPGPDDLNGTEDLVEEEDLGLPDAASMSPGEARDAGLALVRQAYAAGHVAPVKTLQKAWQIAKFYDIPVEKGHEFYQQAVKMAQQVGMHP
jgi:hypothetical protein